MKTAEFKDRIALTLVKDDERVIAAGPLTKQPGTCPYRVVIVNWGDEFSVHNQLFDDSYKDGPITDLADSCSAEFISNLDNGDYFKTEDFVRCIERFAERCKHNAEFVGSIFRQTVESI